MPKFTLRTASALLLAAGLLLTAASQAQLPATYTLDDKKLLWAQALSYLDGAEYHYELFRFDTEAAALACDKNPFACVGNKTVNKQSFRQPLPAVPLYLKDTVINQAVSTISKPIFDTGSKTWVMLRMLATASSDFPKDVNPLNWLDQYALSSLPSLSQIKNDSSLATQRELSRIYDTAGFNTALKAGTVNSSNINIRLVDGTTLLRRAAVLKDAEMVDVLLKNGASANQCTPKCPLSSAIQSQDTGLIKKLLDAGANPNGAPNDYRPLSLAAAIASKDVVELLLSRGADPLLPQTEMVFGGNVDWALLHFAPSSNPAFTDWLQTKIDQALDKSGKYKWTAWIEQNGQKTRLTDQAVIKLKKAPFKIAMQINPEHLFRLVCSQDSSLFRHAQNIAFRTDTLSPFKVGASANDSKYLGCGSIVKENEQWIFDGATKELRYTDIADQKTGTQRIKAQNGFEYSYSVNELIIGESTIPLTQYEGKDLSMIIGTVPNSGMGADYYRPASFTLKFQ